MQANPLPSQSVTVIFQGGINVHQLGQGGDDGSDFMANVAKTRAALPHATIVLSTWDTLALPTEFDSADKLGIDQLILNPDPGGLPNIKFGYDAPNNVNRQIISTQAGLNQVSTEYALKLRTDSYLLNDNLLQFYRYYTQQVTLHSQRHLSSKSEGTDYSPIVVPSFFTIDPSMFEHMAFHISDWAQFGKTERLQAFWSAPLMSRDNATYFESHAQDIDAKFADNTFRTRLAVEQHIASHYANQIGYAATPSYYNELNEQILDAHKAFLASEVIVLDMTDYGLRLPKYEWTLTDAFMAMNCISHDDWYQLFYQYWYPNQVDETRLAHADERAVMKSVAAAEFYQTSPVDQQQIFSRLYP